MPELTWRKSTYSADAANCVTSATAPTGTLHLRKSDEPDVVLTTTPAPFGALMRGLKDHPMPADRAEILYFPQPWPAPGTVSTGSPGCH
ncbi:DUF397 domain-containing protein [Streptomyces antibioticus]